MRNPELIENLAHRLIDDVVDGFRRVIERRHRRKNDGANLGGTLHVAEVSEVQRRFTRHENEFAAFLERDVGCAHEEIIAEGVRDRGQRLHRAWRDDHAVRHERSTADGGRQVVIVVDHAREFLDVFHLRRASIGIVRRAPSLMMRWVSTPASCRTSSVRMP